MLSSVYSIHQCGDSRFFSFTLLSYVTSVSVFGECLHIISLVQWESEWNSCIQTCLFEFMPRSCWEKKSACSSVSLQDTDYISMSSRPGRGKSQPLRGGRSLRLCYNTSQQSSSLDALGDAPQWQSNFFLHLRSTQFTQTLFELPSLPTKVKSNWLIYLLSVKPFPVSGTRWKRVKSGRATALSQELTDCLCRQLYTLPAGDYILTSFYRPLKDKDESGEPFSQSCECNGKGKKSKDAEEWRLK